MGGAGCGAGRGGNYDSTPASYGEDGKKAKILVSSMKYLNQCPFLILDLLNKPPLQRRCMTSP